MLGKERLVASTCGKKMASRSTVRSAAVATLLAAHAALLGYSDVRHSPTDNELGHLVAGLAIWRLGRLDLYYVNPPLTRLIAAAPVAISEAHAYWDRLVFLPGYRPEWNIGMDFVAANRDSWPHYFTLARWALIPVCVFGGYVCYRWADELYGGTAGLFALALWCFSPNVLAWGATIQPDAVASALGIGAAYSFWRWYQAPSMGRAFFAELLLLLPAVAVFALVSSQTGFSRHFRYVLPCAPFVFVAVSRVGLSVAQRQWKIAIPCFAALAWSTVGSLHAYPHSMSYFNELAGGPDHAHFHLVDANVDWGQDLFYLRDWCDGHPEARPLRVAWHSPLEPWQVGIDASLAPASDSPPQPSPSELDDGTPRRLAPRPAPGWYAISVHRLHEPDGGYDYFLRQSVPVARIGYSIYVYFIAEGPENPRQGDGG